MDYSYKTVFVVLLLLLSQVAHAQLPIFPGAEGYAKYTKAGRGGEIIKVTNLNDSGAGSLREACLSSGARVVVFEVSGTITLNSSIVIKNPFITIAGQTAPSPGILIRNAAISIKTKEVLMQHLRLRLGEAPDDTFKLGSTDQAVDNVMIDHLSISWGADENFGFFQGAFQTSNISIANCIISEGLKGGKGMIINQSPSSYNIPIENISITKTIFAHNHKRNPKIKNGVHCLLANNITYNWGLSAVDLGENSELPFLVSVINSVYISGKDTPGDRRPIDFRPFIAQDSKLFLKGNEFNDNIPDDPNDLIFKLSTNPTDVLVDVSPLDHSTVEILDTKIVMDTVTKYAGARPTDRDAVDLRIIEELKGKSGKIRTSMSQVPGGFPQLATNSKNFIIPNNPNGDDDNDGYTNIEEVLHQLAMEIEGKKATSKDIENPTGIDDNLLAKSLKLFPNPATQNISLEFSNDDFGKVQITIIDLTGRIVLKQSFIKTKTLFSSKIQINNDGMYLIEVKGSSGRAIKKIVVN